MNMIKKLIFAPLFLISFAILIYQLNPILKSTDFIFSLNWDILIQFMTVSTLLSLSALFFAILATLAQDLKIVLATGIAAGLSSFIFMEQSQALTFVVLSSVSIILAAIALNSTLRSYLNFQPGKILSPSVKILQSMLIFSFCVVYFLSINKIIAQNGFQIPDSLIDTSLQLLPVDSSTSQPEITPEQIKLLKQNPQALKQYGLDPAMLDVLEKPQAGKELLKQEVKKQLQDIIKPYISFIPPVLALILFLTLQFFASIINIFVSPLLFVIFYVLEKTGYTRYEIEKREVKKLVV